MNGLARCFTPADQEWFARVSGDSNPLHTNAAFASRTFPGAPVVHGVHALLWALDRRCAVDPSIRIGGVQVSFVKPILLGDRVTVGGEGRTIRLLVRGETMAVAALTEPRPPTAVPIYGGIIWQPGSPPLDHTGEDLSGAGGEIELTAAVDELSNAFPHLARATESGFAAGLSAISTLVGMACPGLHSVLSEISATAAVTGRRTLAFGVVRHDRRFSRVEMAVNGPGLAGTVAALTYAFAAPPAGDAAIRELVPPAAFAGQTPLIVGATSGLGATTARLLAAGGARPVLGYRDPVSAEAVLETVRQLGECELTPFDATAPAGGLQTLAAMGWRGGEVYYFASPRIFRRRIEPYQAEDLRDFLSVFVDGFYETVRGLLEIRAGEPLTIFYPSTAALDEPASDLFEYRTAKRAGEELCNRLIEKYRRLRIVSARLPRIETRQTRTVVKARAETPETVMAPFVLEIQAAGRPAGSPP
ncbi:MAG TPA: MaoC/PaaZ C-terminal domain-containing protein [Bryobacteraceae bacterium]|nr:MaoC/PaaZ C-terminal domain-containing protein [Bryobacteraceae bacterium]